MAYLINEQKLVEDNIFKFETRLNSQISRFLDRSPTFVTYFHINTNETTVDGGFRDIEDIIGNKSPIRFQKIENFPLYGLEQVQLSIQDSEEGLNTDYSSECVILPNTIKPLPNDFFMINHVRGSFLFRVVEIQYDNIRPDNYYKLVFKFEYLDDSKVKELDDQVEEKFSCILQNIGSEDTCIIKEEYLDQLHLLDNLYNDIVNTYKIIFYDERYNCFLGESSDGYKLYDPLQSIFFNKHNLLNKKENYKTSIASEMFPDNKRKIKYEKSIYRFFERRDVKLTTQFKYHLIPGMSKKESEFARWYDKSVMILDVPIGNDNSATLSYLPLEIATSFKFNGPTETKYVELMQKFIRRENLTIYDIPLDLNEELLRLNANEEVFYFTPIFMYIIQTIISDFLNEKK